MRHSSIFRSRWMALLWAAGMVYFALDVAGVGATGDGGTAATVTTDLTGAPVSDADMHALANILNAQ